MINKDVTVNKSEDNLQPQLGDVETRSELYNKLTHNELLPPFENSINDSDVKPEHLLKPLKEGNNEDFVLRDNLLCLSTSNYSREFDTGCSTVSATQGNRVVLSGDCEQTRVCAEDFIRSSPLSVGCTEYKEANRKKKKQRNKTRKGRSTKEDVERLQEE